MDAVYDLVPHVISSCQLSGDYRNALQRIYYFIGYIKSLKTKEEIDAFTHILQYCSYCIFFSPKSFDTNCKVYKSTCVEAYKLVNKSFKQLFECFLEGPGRSA